MSNTFIIPSDSVYNLSPIYNILSTSIPYFAPSLFETFPLNVIPFFTSISKKIAPANSGFPYLGTPFSYVPASSVYSETGNANNP